MPTRMPEEFFFRSEAATVGGEAAMEILDFDRGLIHSSQSQLRCKKKPSGTHGNQCQATKQTKYAKYSEYSGNF